MPPGTRRTDPAVETTHNLSGQRLGPKGQSTRERIIATMLRLIDSADEAPITLSAISRESSIRLSNLYLYFPDLGELLLAVLGRVIDQHEPLFLQMMRERWPDDGLEEHSRDFVRAHFAFWRRHTRLLRMRNEFADAGDKRFLAYRSRVSTPAIHLFTEQMDAPDVTQMNYRSVATVLFTGLERVATVVTNPDFAEKSGLPHDEERDLFVRGLADAEAKVVELVLKGMRAQAKAAIDS